MKQLKDYLHLYVGCEVLDLKKDETARLIAVVDRFQNRSAQVEYKEYTAFKYIEEIKPILRRIEDVTESEGIILHNIEMSFHEGFENEITYAAVTHKMLSWGIDLFGLIDAGLAIDRNTLT